LLKTPPADKEPTLLELLSDLVPPCVDKAAYVKAGFFTANIEDEAFSAHISKDAAIQLLSNMHGSYNIVTLVAAFDKPDLAELAATKLKHTLLTFDAFHNAEEKSKAGNAYVTDVIASWPDIPEKIAATVFKVTSEINFLVMR
jgi:aconitate hydratase 2/2-methylisocitrate dehydratase